MNKLINKFLNRETIVYTIFGVLTTVVDFAAFGILYYSLNLGELVSNTLAWVLAVIFAFITNKLFVFESKSFKIQVLGKEVLSFGAARVFSLLIEELILYIFVDLLNMNKLIIKLIANIIVIIVNYVLSKFIIFKKPKQEK